MDIDKVLLEKIKRFEDVKNRLGEITKQIGSLTEQQRALYNAGLELKGGIDSLTALKAEEAKSLEGSKTAGLTLPVGTKPVPAPANPSLAPKELVEKPVVAPSQESSAPVAAPAIPATELATAQIPAVASPQPIPLAVQ